MGLQSERQDTQRSTPLARARYARRRPGQRLKKAQRCKLQQQFLDTFGHLGQGLAMTQLGLSRFTFYAWLRDPDFKARYEAKLATYQFNLDEWLNEQENRMSEYWRSAPDWQLIQRMKIHERMSARRGEKHTIWW